MSLQVQNISKNYKEFFALNNVSFSIDSGEIISILGPSGCGKSTLLQLIAGLQQPDQGKIILENQTISDSSYLLPPEKRPINMVFQDYALWPHMDVRKNVFYGMRKNEKSRKEKEELASSLFTLLHLEGLEEKYPAQLSGGQQQRVAIARALATEPALLLLDEPLSNLDMQLRHEMRNELSYLLRRLRTTVLHVTHDPLEAYALADRILVLRDGKIEQFDTPEQVRENPASLWVAGLLGLNNRLDGIINKIEDAGRYTVMVGDNTIIGFGDLLQTNNVTIIIDSEEIKVVQGKAANTGVNTVDGKVMYSVYEGKKWRLNIETSGGILHVLHASPIASGTAVTLLFQPEDTLIFSKE
ncbi:ABC transporter ATP-binding protein [Gracilibacillus oryzae]|uniref:Carnitine transport ATP-binding protein OpuCA n=1 Tax=Gracilibacillus oryzae TaxID=1672701 RepID=A0A7C8KZN7_9BACI|nr:ABC transporter ATP-binding protein [Gracilibacillus oryzae]KAB8137506.1 ABC transporter ATP-binding protein [Gracilibacillus oryzae]